MIELILRFGIDMNRKDDLVLKGIRSGNNSFTGPYGLQIGITDYCTHECEFCQRFSYLKNVDLKNAGSNFQVDPATFYSLVDDAASLDVEQISIVGVGEPLLHKEIISFIKAVKKRKIRCQVTTNGLMLTDEAIEDLLKSGVDIINVSVNAASQDVYEKVHGAGKGKHYETLVKNLSTLGENKTLNRDSPLTLSLRYVAYRSNLADLENFVFTAIKVKADKVVFQNIFPPPFAPELELSADEKRSYGKRLRIMEEKLTESGIETNAGFVADINDPPIDDEKLKSSSIFDYYRHNSCYVGWTYTMIMEDGTVRPCCYCGLVLGNINENSFKDIWSSASYNKFRAEAINLPTSQVTISKCQCFGLCGSIHDTIKTEQRLEI